MIYLKELKRIILFWKYRKVKLELSAEIIYNIKCLAKQNKVSTSVIVERILQDYIKRNG